MVPAGPETGYIKCQLGGATIDRFSYFSPAGQNICLKEMEISPSSLTVPSETIKSISPAEISPAKGAVVSIEGHYSKKTGLVRVLHGDAECLMKAVEDTRVLCALPALSGVSSTRMYPGMSVKCFTLFANRLSFSDKDQLFNQSVNSFVTNLASF
ncbi:hypothetical protein FGIG_11005 [Fasciola gigantica]|uniref:IPT/TIG domain-containing protein n=1 Tax=Fasciola gigantica TaxID=46835 RepID=A0A504YGQ9_FASGI|nr:hypothetical protein FGIG_11005 [Fasciola gigantica]